MAKRGTEAWKMNIAKGKGNTSEETLCCPYCKGEGYVQNPGYELRIRRQQAGLNQWEFAEICGWSRTSIQEVERGLRPPNPHLIEEYRRLQRVNQY